MTLMISMHSIHVGLVISVQSLKTVTICPNDKPWMDSKVRLAIRRRDRLLRIHNLHPCPVTWESYRAQRIIVTSLIRFAKNIIL